MDRKIPNSAAIIPLNTLSPVTEEIIIRPRNARAAYSVQEKFTHSFARYGEKKHKIPQLNSPPKPEAQAAHPIAWAPLSCFIMG